jgi:hypothetical protein
MNTILITGIGGPTPRSIAKTIRRFNPYYTIIGIDSNPKALGFFMPGLVDKYLCSPKATEDTYWPFINELIFNQKIDLAFVQPESEVIEWGKYFEIHGTFPSHVFIPPVKLASVLIDKSKMAEILEGTEYIPKTMRVSQSDPRLSGIATYIKYPCWIRAITGSGALGSLKVENSENLKSWLVVNREINDFTVSEFLPGRHLATQMLYFDGEYIKGASLECVEYVMASIAPSKVTGNTSFGRFINEDRILAFCDDCIRFICNKLHIKAHGVLSFDLKEDLKKNLKVTEVNIRHMAYTGVMAQAGFDLIQDTITILKDGNAYKIMRQPYFRYDKPYVFLRDVDTEPVILNSEDVFLRT